MSKQETPICPEETSHGEMRLKTAKRGANAGGKFWSCQKFPACTATRDFEGADIGKFFKRLKKPEATQKDIMQSLRNKPQNGHWLCTRCNETWSDSEAAPEKWWTVKESGPHWCPQCDSYSYSIPNHS